MRFRFCGDLDCPDWVLAEINTLSKMSSIKMKILCSVVATALTGQQLDKEKAKKMTGDAKLDEDAMKACVSVISHILTSSARYGVESEVLGHELEQLGLPKEHATAVCKVYKETLPDITAHLKTELLRVSSLQHVRCQTDPSIKAGDWTAPGARLNLKVLDRTTNTSHNHSVTMSSAQLAMLINNMKDAKKVMDSDLTNQSADN